MSPRGGACTVCSSVIVLVFLGFMQHARAHGTTTCCKKVCDNTNWENCQVDSKRCHDWRDLGINPDKPHGGWQHVQCCDNDGNYGHGRGFLAFYENVWGTERWYYCKACSYGEVSVFVASQYPDGQEMCVKGCAAGQYGPQEGNCQNCAAGTASATAGRTSACDACAYGLQSAAGATACGGCGAGQQPKADKTGCDSCSAGKKSAGNAWCTDCDYGTQSETGWSACKGCGAGQQPKADKSGCEACGDGLQSPGNDWCRRCPEAQQATADQKGCELCGAGWYKIHGELKCVQCDPGYAAENTGNSQCTKCRAGKYANAGVNKLGSTLCRLCGTDTYAREPGTTAPGNQLCTMCEAGKYTQCAGCSPLEGASECLTHQEFCVRDTNYCGASSTNPQCHCCSGQFLQVDNGVRKCLSCPVTRYMDENAHTKDACKTCVEGRYPTSMPGADWQDAMVPVGLGLQNHGAIECVGTLAAVNCSFCSAGKYKQQVGFGTCTECARGRYSDSGFSVCADCLPGKYANVTGATLCIDCAAGKYKEVGGFGVCIDCASGQYSANASASACTNCSAGKYANITAATFCIDCVAGKHKKVEGFGVCIDCARGHYSANASASACTDCSAGNYAEVTAATVCTDCAVGKYSGLNASTNASNCMQCPKFSSTFSTGASRFTDCLCTAGYEGPPGNCTVCPAGKYKGTLGSSCWECGPGKFSGIGATVCTTCVAGKYKPGAGSIRPSFSIRGDILYASYVKGLYYWHSVDANALPVYKKRSAWGESDAYLYYSAVSGYWHLYWEENMDTAALYYEKASFVPDPAQLTGEFWLEAHETEFQKSDARLELVLESDCYDCQAGEYSDPGAGRCESCPAGAFSSLSSGKCTLCDANMYKGTAGLNQPAYIRFLYSAGYEELVIDLRFGERIPDTNRLAPAAVEGESWSDVWLQNLDLVLPPDAYGCYAWNSTAGRGKIALIQRGGGCGFADKTWFAQESGAMAVVIYNNREQSSFRFQMYDDKYDITIPAGMIHQALGNKLALEVNVSSVGVTAPSYCRMCPGNSTSGNGSSECVCPAGFTGPNNSPCSPCVAGTYKNTSGSLACTSCPANTWGTQQAGYDRELHCQPCPQNFTSVAGSANKESCVCKGGFTHVNGSACWLCAAGKYKTQTGPETCNACPGNSSSSPGSASRTDCLCNAGYTGANGSVCSACDSGKYKAVVGPATCSACPGNSSSAPGSVAVTDCLCNAGYTGANGSVCSVCEAGRYKDLVGPAKCSACPNNSSSAPGSIPLTDCVCNAGHTGANGTVCLACDVGKYKDGAGPANCSACPGNSSAARGSVLLTDCVCNRGYTGANGTVCSACDVGKYKDRIGPANCSACPGNSSSALSSVSLTDCVCNAGYTGANGSACSACDAGKYKNRIGPATCSACPGNSSSAPGSVSLTDCVCNRGYTGANGSACSACVVGKYKDGAGPANCSECPGNSSSTSGSVSLTDCLCNARYTGANGSVCSACEAGKYKDRVGPGNCSACPGNSSSATGSLSLTDCLCNAGYTPTNESFCSACDAGKYKDRIGPATCSVCPGNSSSTPGSVSLTDCLCNGGYTGANGSVCSACDAGKYKDRIGPATCSVCPGDSSSTPGSVSLKDCVCNAGYTGANGSVCSACDAGKYKDEVGPANCSACPGNASSAPGSRSLTDCLCNAGYTGANGSVCSACGVGEYKEEAGPANCTACPGNAQSAPGSLSLTDCLCNAGYTGANGSVCSACSMGKYKEEAGPAKCKTCPGNATIALGSLSLSECLCPAGTSGFHGLNCTTCAAGKFTARANSTVCDNCTAGMYKRDAGWPRIGIGRSIDSGAALCWPYLEGTYYLESRYSEQFPVYAKKIMLLDEGPAYLYHSAVSGYWHLYWKLELDTAAMYCDAPGTRDPAELQLLMQGCVWRAACYGEWTETDVRVDVNTHHECYACQTGESAAEGSESCEACPAGTFSMDSFLGPGTASSCTLCDAGKYKETVGRNQPAHVLFSFSDGQIELPFDLSFGEDLTGDRFVPSLDHGDYWFRIQPVARGLVVPSDPFGCSTWNASGLGKIALVKRGGLCGFSDKMFFAMRANAEAVIIYNDRAQSSFRFPMFASKYVKSIDNITIPGGMMHLELGELLANKSVNVTVPSFCRSCPENSWSVAGNTLATGCVCNEGFTGPPGGPCRVKMTNKTFWHRCEGTFDCKRLEYLPPNITVPEGPAPIVSDDTIFLNGSCIDNKKWFHSVPGFHKVTCDSYANDNRHIGYCYEDHFNPLPWEPLMIQDTSGQYVRAPALKTCMRCCETCYKTCCLEYGLCPGTETLETTAQTTTQTTPKPTTSSSTTPSPTTPRPSIMIWHHCDGRYDCARGEYVPYVSSATPAPTTTSTTPAPTTTSTTPAPTTSSTPELTTSSTTPEPTTSTTPAPTTSTTPELTTSSTPEPTTSSTTPAPTTSSTTPAPTTSSTTPKPTTTTTPKPTTTTTPAPTTTTPSPFKTVWHHCDRQYDCARGDYVRYESSSTPPPTTPPPTSAPPETPSPTEPVVVVVIDLFLPGMRVEDFPAVEPELRSSISDATGVDESDIFFLLRRRLPGGRRLLSDSDAEEGIDVTVFVGSPIPVASCETVAADSCPGTENTGENLMAAFDSDTALPSIQFAAAPRCQKCVNAEHLEFASSGDRDNDRSCKKQCASGYFRLFNLDSQVCVPHTVTTCPDGQYVRNGTRERDAECVLCSQCEGRRLVANCSRYADTDCEDCGVAKEHQRWTGTACKPVCEDGFVWDARSRECEFCGTYVWEGGSWRKDARKCPPGLRKPAEPDNCTHCVPCTGLPEHATWSGEDDRADCLWSCEDEYQLTATAAGEACVRRKSVELVPPVPKTEPVCDPGGIPIDFKCVPCFDAASLQGSGVQLSDLPRKSQQGKTWDWLYGCRWQCLHVNDFWEIQAESGLYWDCKTRAERDRLLQGLDLSWLDLRRSGAPPPNSSQAPETRSQDGEQGRATLLRTAAVVAALPVAALLYAVIAGCWRAWATGEEGDSEETVPLV